MKSHKFFKIIERAKQTTVIAEVMSSNVEPIEEISLPASNVSTPAPEVKTEFLSSVSKPAKKKT
jgi:hypothetical protein